jgi:hypothetical protein|tara:strand:- start:760 stop:951 length:192 start_codon:yes stop_codon:yes gene_type:complete
MTPHNLQWQISVSDVQRIAKQAETKAIFEIEQKLTLILAQSLTDSEKVEHIKSYLDGLHRNGN